jgi:type II secretory pathway component PulF
MEYWKSFAFQHLALMVEAGMPLNEAFSVVADDIPVSSIAKKLRKCAAKSASGTQLRDIKAFRKLIPDGSAGLFDLAATPSETASVFRHCADWIQETLDMRMWLQHENLYPNFMFFMILIAMISIGNLVSGKLSRFVNFVIQIGHNHPVYQYYCLPLIRVVSLIWLPSVIILAFLWIVLRSGLARRMPFSILYWNLPFISWKSKSRFSQLLLMYLKYGFEHGVQLRDIFERMRSSCRDGMWRSICKRVAAALDGGTPADRALEMINVPDLEFNRIVESWSDGAGDAVQGAMTVLQAGVQRKFTFYTHTISVLLHIGTAVFVGSIVIAAYLPLFAMIDELSR